MNKADLVIQVYVLTKLEGGRGFPFSSGFRAQLFYNNSDWTSEFYLIDKEQARPSEIINLSLQTLNPVSHFGKFEIGRKISIRYGSNIVAKGQVVKIINPNFAKA